MKCEHSLQRNKLRNIFALLFIGVACTHFTDREPAPRSQLSEQILSHRPGYTELTNQRCVEYRGEKCTKKDVRTYDLRAQGVRDILNELGFECQIGTKIYRICPDKPGYCRNENCTTDVAGRRCDRSEILIKDIEKLLLLGVICKVPQSHSL